MRDRPRVARVGARGVFVRMLGRLAAPIVEEAQVQIRRKRAPEIESQSRPITQRRIELHRSYLTAPECHPSNCRE
jgi:hypothetical protein